MTPISSSNCPTSARSSFFLARPDLTDAGGSERLWTTTFIFLLSLSRSSREKALPASLIVSSLSFFLSLTSLLSSCSTLSAFVLALSAMSVFFFTSSFISASSLSYCVILAVRVLYALLHPLQAHQWWPSASRDCQKYSKTSALRPVQSACAHLLH